MNLFWHVKFFEGLDPTSKPPLIEQVSIKMTDNTKQADFIDPEAVGTYYVTTDQNFKNKGTFKMGIDPSNVSLQFDSTKLTTLIIYPIQIKPNNVHKANVFPPNFTLTVTLPSPSNTYTMQYQDISSNTMKNTFTTYTSPGGDISGNFMSIVTTNTVMPQPMYADQTPQSAIGSIDASTKNTFTITITKSGNSISGFLLHLTPT
jgi:hypothetical protein